MLESEHLDAVSQTEAAKLLNIRPSLPKARVGLLAN
jgi:hypothetical protein